MDSSKIKIFVLLAISFFFALYLGVAAATAQTEALSWIVGGGFLGLCLLLGRNVWILIPATLAMRGGVNLLPGMIPPWVFMTAATGVFFLIRVGMHRQSLAIKWTWMETSLALVALTIFQALLRNPVGLRALGGDTAGGKPYFIFIFAFAAYYLIVASKPNLKTWCWAVILFISLGIVDGVIQALSALYPQFAQTMVRFYSNVSFNEAMGQGGVYELSERRFGFLAQIGSLLGLVACSYWRPMAAMNLAKPWRAVTAGLGVVCVLLSGFRSTSAELFIRFCVGSAIRRKFIDAVLLGVVAAIAVAFIAMSDTARSLPFGIQRVLTAVPFPIRVDPRAQSQAENSASDRFEMWQIVLSSDRYIKNKILGDGFQFSAVEINAMSESRMAGSRFKSISFVERSLEVGNYHGFHVETIRFTGVFGLIAATITLFVFARFAFRSIQLHRDTQAWSHVVFVCMPFLIYPLWYWLVFGSFRAEFPQLIAMAAMVKVAYEIGIAGKLEQSPVKAPGLTQSGSSARLNQKSS